MVFINQKYIYVYHRQAVSDTFVATCAIFTEFSEMLVLFDKYFTGNLRLKLHLKTLISILIAMLVYFAHVMQFVSD